MIMIRDNIQKNLGVYLKKKKMSQKKLAELLDVSQTAVTNWIKGKNSPEIDTLFQISEILDISLAEMTGTAPGPFSQEECAYIEKWNQLDKYGKELIDLVLDKELERIAAVSDSDTISTSIEDIKILSIPFFRLPVSAGTGIYLEEEEEESLELEVSSLAEQADFALRVSGNSMEPSYHNGDILLVQERNAIEVGDCGIFILNGEGYFKKLGQNQLISLNPNYQPIPFHQYDNVRCVGKVIGVAR